LKSLLDPIIISLVTRSSFATLPSAIKSLSQDLGYYERSTNLFFSLGTTLGRFGNILYFSIAAIFVAQLYGAELGIMQYGILALGSLLAGVATAGASGIATLNLMSIVLTPLSLPFEAVIIIFIAIDTIADPMRTMLIVLTNMAANTLIVPRVDPMNRRTVETKRPEALEAGAPSDLFSRILGRRELIVAMEGRNTPPFYSADQDGVIEGLSIDCAKALADKLGVSLKLNRKAATASDVVRLVRENEADIALGSCNFHKVFENELLYSRPYISTREAMLADKNRLTKLKQGDNLLSSLKTYEGRVGVVKGSIHEKMATRLFPKARLQSLASSEDLADAVSSGEILAAFGNEIELRTVLEKRPSWDSSLTVVVFSNLPADFRFGVAPGHANAVLQINQVIAARQGRQAATPSA
jgi:ABC-type amino acid transport substrate-binding protein